MTNYSFLTVTRFDEFYSFSIEDISSYIIKERFHERIIPEDISTIYFTLTITLKSGNEYILYFKTLEEAKNSIKIIGDIRCQ